MLANYNSPLYKIVKGLDYSISLVAGLDYSKSLVLVVLHLKPPLCLHLGFECQLIPWPSVPILPHHAKNSAPNFSATFHSEKNLNHTILDTVIMSETCQKEMPRWAVSVYPTIKILTVALKFGVWA